MNERTSVVPPGPAYGRRTIERREREPGSAPRVIFQKLGISSRAELIRLGRDGETAPQPE